MFIDRRLLQFRINRPWLSCSPSYNEKLNSDSSNSMMLKTKGGLISLNSRSMFAKCWAVSSRLKQDGQNWCVRSSVYLKVTNGGIIYAFLSYSTSSDALKLVILLSVVQKLNFLLLFIILLSPFISIRIQKMPHHRTVEVKQIWQ